MKSPEFQSVYERGFKISGKRIQFLCLPNSQERARIGLAVGRRFGNAVRRNHLKRWLREAIRQNGPLMPAGFDVVAFPKRRTDEICFQVVQSDVLHLCDTLKRRGKIVPFKKSDSA